LFVIESLNLGGAEKSLVTLLNLLDYEKYDVDLQLFTYGGDFEKLLPKNVKLLPTLEYFEYCNISYQNFIKKIKKPKMFVSQLRYSIKLRTGRFNNIEKSVFLWTFSKYRFRFTKKKYDVAIAYAQGVPTFYVADKVNAKKKIGWINATYIPKGKYNTYINNYYKKFDYINCVSESVKIQFCNTFPNQVGKEVIIKDILDYSFNKKMLQLPSDVYKEFDKNCQLIILTVGRMCFHKGYDLAVEACRILKEKKIEFKWYVIGNGDKREFIERKIIEYKLQNNFILLGAKGNPYPYFKACDIYVQTSRHEGFGITLAEARMFNKPIVTTKFDAVYSQIIPNKNGLIVEISGEAIADGIIKMINNDNYRANIIRYLKSEKKGNLEELEKFYNIIE
ncbi:glycosyltransferase, partial [Thomasclavelia sp.]